MNWLLSVVWLMLGFGTAQEAPPLPSPVHAGVFFPDTDDAPAKVIVVPKKPEFSFQFPKIIQGTVQKDPEPAPTPSDPAVPPVLKAGQLYVIPSEEKFFLRALPPGLVTIKAANSPLNIYGNFVDDETENERTYPQPFIYIVKAVPGKTGDVYLEYIPSGVIDDTKITSILIRIGAAPQPPPEPKPDDSKPDDPKPQPTDKLKAMVEDITSRYSTLPVADKAAIAAGFREAGAQVAAGSIADTKQLTKVTSDLILAKLGSDVFLPWTPWKSEISKAVLLQNPAGIKDYTKYWNTVADVLEGK